MYAMNIYAQSAMTRENISADDDFFFVVFALDHEY